jgi:hypothetical protein
MMTTKNESLPSSEQFTGEAGGWIACRLPRPELQGAAEQLLTLSAKSRPGNLRLAIEGHQVYMLGELRDPNGLLTFAEANERLATAASDAPSQVSQLVQVPQLEVACLLGETGYQWTQPQDDPNQWQAIANDPLGCRCKLTATIIADGVEVCGLPSSWEFNFAEASESALRRFLAAAHSRIRFARFILQDHEPRAVSFAATDRLDIELPDSVAAVVAACRLVWREVSALADPAVAQAYLKTMQ